MARKIGKLTEGDNSEYVLKQSNSNADGSIANEVAVLKRLQGHPNIMSLVDNDLQGSTPYHVTPFYEGGSLRRPTLKNWTIDELNPQYVGELLNQVAKAIGFMHSQGVIHGELISQHIVLKKDRTPVIIDFETAKIFDGYFPDTENDVQRFGRLYQQVMRDCKAVRMPKLEERRHREQVAGMGGKQPTPSTPPAGKGIANYYIPVSLLMNSGPCRLISYKALFICDNKRPSPFH